MKKILSIAISASLALAFNIKTDYSNLHRQAPNKSNVVLSYSPIIKKIMPSIVTIYFTGKEKIVIPNALNTPFFNKLFGPINKEKVSYIDYGTGIIISKDGYIVTNNHVIKDATKIIVIDNNGKKYTAKRIGGDLKTDLAVIKIEAKNLQPITFADSNKVEVGDIAIAIGNPLTLRNTVTQGIVSAINRHKLGIYDYEDFIQTDAAINPGNSGGALVDLKGRLIGINSDLWSKYHENNGLGLAIPSNLAKFIATSLIKNNGVIKRGDLGIEMSDININNKNLYGISYGVLVNRVIPRGAAQEAGLKAGDIILAINGKKTKDSWTLRNKIAFLGPNKEITLKIYRDSKIIYLKAKLKLNESIILDKNTKISQKNGKVMIVDMKPKSKFALAGVQRGDVISAIKTKKWVKINSIDELIKILKNTKAQMLFKITRGNEVIIVQIY